MTAAILNYPVIWSIRGYQRWLSPLKGYRCAHDVVHGDGSCSCYGLSVFQNHSIFKAWKLLQNRLQECREALTIYNSLSPEEQRRRRQQRRDEIGNTASNACDDCSDTCSTMAVFEAFNCDLSACDIGDCDVSSCGD